ncbi:MAG TPA: SLC13 family permease [Anaerolineaceae bacterium]|nr:SLC13 family permease [Anaerolineaceae bacterium]
MTLEQLLLIVILIVPLALALVGRLRMDVAALLVAAVLGLGQALGLGLLGPANTPILAVRAISGFGQPAVVTLLALFILTRALEKCGVTAWLTRPILRLAAGSEVRLIGLFAAGSAFLSLFMNNVAAGALLLPAAMQAARQTGVRPSRLLMPVSFGSLLGGMATYFTTANILISGLLTSAEPPQPPLGILDFTPTGGLIALGGLAFLALLGRRVLPQRTSLAGDMLPRPSSPELEETYQLDERLWELRILPGSPLNGQTLLALGLGEKYGLTVAAVVRRAGTQFSPPPDTIVQCGDLLLTIGRAERVNQLLRQRVQVEPCSAAHTLAMRGVDFVELVLAPHSSALGKTLKTLNFRRRYGLTALAVQRLGRTYRTDVGDLALQPGDSLLMIGEPVQVRALRSHRDFIVLEAGAVDHPVNWRQTMLSVGILLGVIVASIAGVPVYLAALVGVTALLALGGLSTEEAYAAVEWPVIILVAGMAAASTAMVQTGLAAQLGQALTTAAGPLGPLGLAAGAFLFSALLTQVMGGQVTALVSGPVVISAALQMGVNPQAAAVAAAIGCSAAFLTPFAHPVNLLMLSPGAYTPADFLRVGWKLLLLSFILLLLGMKLFWGL